MGFKKWFRKVTDLASLDFSDRLFQSRGALMAKAQPPLVLSLNFGTARRVPPKDLRLRIGSTFWLCSLGPDMHLAKNSKTAYVFVPVTVRVSRTIFNHDDDTHTHIYTVNIQSTMLSALDYGDILYMLLPLPLNHRMLFTIWYMTEDSYRILGKNVICSQVSYAKITMNN